MTVTAFDFHLPTRIVQSLDAIDQLGPWALQFGARRVLVVSDRGVSESGHTQHGMVSLRDAGLQVLCFDKVHENPTTDDVAAGLEVAQSFAPDLLVGLGGGSSMDCAKGINFLFTNGGQMKDYWGVGKARQPMLPMIAVPTTAGTGSEAQSFALISDAQTRAKMACGDKKAACRLALLDPRLTLTQPPRVTALTGIDAVAHALETLVANKNNPLSRTFSRESWRLLSGHFRRVLDDPLDLEARAGMQLGACLAGVAIEHSMLGAAHGLADPLTAHYGIVHGQAVGLMLPHVIRFNAELVGRTYRDLIQSTHLGGLRGVSDLDADGLAAFVSELAVQAGLPRRLSDCGVEESVLPKLAADAARQWTTSFNPRPTDTAALLTLYRRAY